MKLCTPAQGVKISATTEPRYKILGHGVAMRMKKYSPGYNNDCIKNSFQDFHGDFFFIR